MDSPAITIILVITGAVLLVAAAGIWISGRSGKSTGIVSLSGGVLAGIALFWVLPELCKHFGWVAGPVWLMTGFFLLWLVDRFLYPVCPACSHTHDHGACSTPLHGFALPLILAAGVHSFFDGLGLAASHEAVAGELGRAVFWGIALHKLPEGLALGAILRASLRTGVAAGAAAVATQIPMLAGGAVEILLSPYLEAQWLAVLLGIAGGSFLYLGIHTMHGEWKRRGPAVAFFVACAGVAAAAILRHSLGLLGH